jgi:hypothetical protein
MGNIEAVNATKTITGQEAQDIVAVWRKQRFTRYTEAACHQPPYALEFYSKGRVVLFATICWMCNNVNFITPDIGQWVYFDSDSKEAEMLKAVFKKAFPAEKTFG